MNRQEALDLIVTTRREWEAAVSRFDEGQMTEALLPEGWSVKDAIAHIGFWEGRIARLYEILTEGETPVETFGESDVDFVNARAYQENQDLPLETVLANERRAYQALLSVAETAPEIDLFNNDRFPWTEGYPFINMILGNTHYHYLDHIPDLTAAASGQ